MIGAAMAVEINRGFLVIRKGGSLCVATDEVQYSYSKGKGKRMGKWPTTSPRRFTIAPSHLPSHCRLLRAQSAARPEIRANAFKPGTRVILVDQWVDSGGSMRAAIELIERQKGVVAAIGTIRTSSPSTLSAVSSSSSSFSFVYLSAQLALFAFAT